MPNNNISDKRKALRLAYKKLKKQSENFEEDIRTFHKNYTEPVKCEPTYLKLDDYLIETEKNAARKKTAQANYECQNKEKIKDYQKRYRLKNSKKNTAKREC